MKHAWIGEAVPICAYMPERKDFYVEIRWAKYASQATCLECIARIR